MRQPTLIVAVFIDTAGYGIVVPLLPLFATRLGAGATEVGFLTSLYALTQLICLPAIGALSDRAGRRRVLAICLAGSSVAYLLLAAADTLALLVAALLLDAATGGNLSVAQAYVVEHTPPEKRARALGQIGAAFGLGVVVGPALGAALAALGLQPAALVAATLAGANALLVVLTLPRDQRTNTTHIAGDRSVSANRGRWPLLARRSRRELGGLLLSLFLLNLAFAGLQSNFPLFSKARFGWGPSENGLLFALVGGCAVFAQAVLIGWLQPRLGGERLAALGFAALAGGLAATGLAPSSAALYPALALAALGSSLAIPALAALLSLRAPAEHQGALLGITGALLSLTQVFGPPLAGLSFDMFGPPAPYLLGGALALGGLAALVVATRAHRREAATISNRSQPG